MLCRHFTRHRKVRNGPDTRPCYTSGTWISFSIWLAGFLMPVSGIQPDIHQHDIYMLCIHFTRHKKLGMDRISGVAIHPLLGFDSVSGLISGKLDFYAGHYSRIFICFAYTALSTRRHLTLLYIRYLDFIQYPASWISYAGIRYPAGQFDIRPFL